MVKKKREEFASGLIVPGYLLDDEMRGISQLV
jgi:hypothetical protein